MLINGVDGLFSADGRKRDGSAIGRKRDANGRKRGRKRDDGRKRDGSAIGNMGKQKSRLT